MKYIFLDLEFNQSYTKNNFNMPTNPKCPLEIIEIGAIKLDENFEIIDRFTSFVQPFVYNKLSPVVERLTGIKENQIKNAPKFEEAIWNFVRWLEKGKIEEYIIFVWGSDDLPVLQNNFDIRKMKSMSWMLNIIDLQNRISNIYKYKFKKEQISLNEMLNYYKLDVNYPRHRAFSDAKYMSKVFIEAFNRLGIKNVIKLFDENFNIVKNWQ